MKLIVIMYALFFISTNLRAAEWSDLLPQDSTILEIGYVDVYSICEVSMESCDDVKAEAISQQVSELEAFCNIDVQGQLKAQTSPFFDTRIYDSDGFQTETSRMDYVCYRSSQI